MAVLSLFVLTPGDGGARQARLLFLLFLDPRINLFPMNGHVPRGIDTQTYLTTLHVENRDIDVVANLEGFTYPAGQYEHFCGSMWCWGRPICPAGIGAGGLPESRPLPVDKSYRRFEYSIRIIG